MTSTEIALLLNDDTEKVLRIGEIISKKISKRDVFENLNEFEKTFIYIDVFENHTTNGGFEEFFWNASGQFAHEILEAYHKIEATETAECIYNSFVAFGEIPIPKNTNERQLILSKLSPEIWDDLNEKFYKCKDNIVALILNFVTKNIKNFD